MITDMQETRLDQGLWLWFLFYKRFLVQQQLLQKCLRDEQARLCSQQHEFAFTGNSSRSSLKGDSQGFLDRELQVHMVLTRGR